MQPEHQPFQVKQDFHHVFLHAIDGGVLMQHAGDPDFGRSVAGHGRQQYTAQRIAQRMAITALKGLHHHFRIVCWKFSAHQ